MSKEKLIEELEKEKQCGPCMAGECDGNHYYFHSHEQVMDIVEHHY